MQGWARHALLMRKLRRLHRKAVLRATLRSWLAHSSRTCAMRRKAGALVHGAWRLRRLAVFVRGWAVMVERLARLRRAGRALEAAVR